jgi:hypothetical protein
VKLNGIQQLLVNVGDSNLLGENVNAIPRVVTGE